MKKTLIASAVAAATLSTSAFAMDSDKADKLLSMLEHMPKISGNIQLAMGYTDDNIANNDTSTGLVNNGSTLRFDHSSAINEDVTAFMRAEFEFDAANKSNGGIAKTDEAYIGIKGGFGQIWGGTDDTVYEKVDIIDYVEYTGVAGDLAGVNESQTIQYMSPELGDGTGLKAGITVETNEDDANDGAAVVTWGRDNINVNLGYALGGSVGTTDTGDTFGISASIGLEDLTLYAQYESKDSSTTGSTDNQDGVDLIGLRAQYVMGQNQFNLAYKQLSMDVANTDTSDIGVQALRNFSDNFYAYIEARFHSSDVTNADYDDYGVGATYVF